MQAFEEIVGPQRRKMDNHRLICIALALTVSIFVPEMWTVTFVWKMYAAAVHCFRFLVAFCPHRTRNSLVAMIHCEKKKSFSIVALLWWYTCVNSANRNQRLCRHPKKSELFLCTLTQLLDYRFVAFPFDRFPPPCISPLTLKMHILNVYKLEQHVLFDCISRIVPGMCCW